VITVSARPWQLPLRGGLFSLAVAFGACAVVTELNVAGSDMWAAILGPILPPLAIALGIALLIRALPKLARDGRLGFLALHVRNALPQEFAILSGYLPRDADGAIDLVIVGPTGVFAVEVCESAASLACYQDIWYRRHGSAQWRVAESPSRAARRSAERLLSDVRAGGFARTPVWPVVLLVHGHVVEVNGCCAVVAQGLSALVEQVRLWNRAPLSDQRARAIAHTLSGKLSIA
jgi:hypothetical protein